MQTIYDPVSRTKIEFLSLSSGSLEQFNYLLTLVQNQLAFAKNEKDLITY